MNMKEGKNKLKGWLLAVNTFGIENWENLLKKDFLDKVLNSLVNNLQFTDVKTLFPESNDIKDKIFVPFPGGGWTAIRVIAESHIAIHTVHEEKALRMEISSCKWFDKNKAIKIIKKEFKATKINYTFYDWQHGRII